MQNEKKSERARQTERLRAYINAAKKVSKTRK